jgi:glycosyltransferase involved in cell wall biosynthesis
MPLHGYGGLERSVHDLVTHLAARGVEVRLIAPPPTKPSGAGDTASSHAKTQRREAEETLGPWGRASALIQVREVPYWTFPFANRRGTTILDRSTAYPLFGMRAGSVAVDLDKQNAIDIVHGFGASVLGYAIARGKTGAARARSPLVLNPQGLEEFGATAGRQAFAKRIGYTPLRAAVRACARAADAIIATDRALEPTVERHLHPRPGQMRTIPNGIDVPAADALAGPEDGLKMRQRAGIGADETVILTAGRIEFNKGADVLAAALARVFGPGAPRSSAAWRWVIAGDGPFKPDLERAIAASGIGGYVQWAGRVPDRDLHAWYEAATLFVHPTRYEGSSLVTLEAMAHRRAIVASRAGGLPDKVQDGVNGWLVDPGDAGELARAIDEALSNPARLSAMGKESRRILESRFAWTALADEHIALYDELRQRR